MQTVDLDRYIAQALEAGITGVREIGPDQVTTAPWVPLKCQFGCPNYGLNYTCPPQTLRSEQTRTLLDSYGRILLFHIQSPPSPERGKRMGELLALLTDMEGELFKDGCYRAFLLVAGPCRLCKTCGIIDGLPCRNRHRARPSLESFGIDVFQTARDNGFPIETLHHREETRNQFCLMLVD